MTTAISPSSPKRNVKGEKKNKSFSSGFERLNLPLHGVRLPSFKIEDRHLNDLALDKGTSTYNFLRE